MKSGYYEYRPHHLKRVLWFLVNHSIYRLCSAGFMRPVGNAVLRMFGAKIGKMAMVYGTANVYAPWNLILGDYCCIGPHANIYNKDLIHIKRHSVISQGAYLCAASHDYTDRDFHLVTKPITIGADAWICSEAFVGPGVTVGDGCVVGARSVVTKDVEPYCVVAGNPARFIKKRIIRDEQ